MALNFDTKLAENCSSLRLHFKNEIKMKYRGKCT